MTSALLLVAVLVVVELSYRRWIRKLGARAHTLQQTTLPQPVASEVAEPGATVVPLPDRAPPNRRRIVGRGA